MDLITGQRTYVVGVSGTLTANTAKIVELPFVDTSGNVINCNYCKIQFAGTTAGGVNTAIVLEPSGLSREGDMVTNELSALQDDASLAASGILGIGIVDRLAGNIAEWHGSNGEVAAGAKLQILSSSTNYQCMVTYGNIYPLNTLRLEQSYDRGV